VKRGKIRIIPRRKLCRVPIYRRQFRNALAFRIKINTRRFENAIRRADAIFKKFMDPSLGRPWPHQ